MTCENSIASCCSLDRDLSNKVVVFSPSLKLQRQGCSNNPESVIKLDRSIMTFVDLDVLFARQ